MRRRPRCARRPTPPPTAPRRVAGQGVQADSAGEIPHPHPSCRRRRPRCGRRRTSPPRTCSVWPVRMRRQAPLPGPTPAPSCLAASGGDRDAAVGRHRHRLHPSVWPVRVRAEVGLAPGGGERVGDGAIVGCRAGGRGEQAPRGGGVAALQMHERQQVIGVRAGMGQADVLELGQQVAVGDLAAPPAVQPVVVDGVRVVRVGWSTLAATAAQRRRCARGRASTGPGCSARRPAVGRLGLGARIRYTEQPLIQRGRVRRRAHPCAVAASSGSGPGSGPAAPRPRRASPESRGHRPSCPRETPRRLRRRPARADTAAHR